MARSCSRQHASWALRALSPSEWTRRTDQVRMPLGSRCAIQRASPCSGNGARIGTSEINDNDADPKSAEIAPLRAILAGLVVQIERGDPVDQDGHALVNPQ